MPIIGVDIEGSDASRDLLLQACYESAELIDGKIFCYSTVKSQKRSSSVEEIHCADVISMDDVALRVVRKKKDFTLIRALRDLSAGTIDALVTCAHTGALTAAAVLYLKRFTNLRRPGLLVELPLKEKNITIIDVGAFLSSSAEDLFGFAKLGGAYASLSIASSRPRIGLLNIGKESMRGPKEICRADEMLRSSSLPCTYIGSIEPYDVLSGEVDVCVCDGMIGNVFLKTAEAVTRLADSPNLRHENRAALLAGMQGLVLKCHGEGSPQALLWAIQHASKMVHFGFIHSLHKAFTGFV